MILSSELLRPYEPDNEECIDFHIASSVLHCLPERLKRDKSFVKM
ncbi:MAG: hypothetical protein ACYCS0_09135 [bacterium]